VDSMNDISCFSAWLIPAPFPTITKGLLADFNCNMAFSTWDQSARLLGICSNVKVGTWIKSPSDIFPLRISPDTSIYVTPGLPTQLNLIAFSMRNGAYFRLLI
jgi:hypothetical protein